MANLTEAQKRALLVFEQPWTAAWWGGKPHGTWPIGVNTKSFDSLLNLRLIRVQHSGRFDRTVQLTEAGRAALQEAGR